MSRDILLWILYVIVIIVHISEVYVNLVPKRLIVINPVPSCMLPEIGPELSKVKIETM